MENVESMENKILLIEVFWGLPPWLHGKKIFVAIIWAEKLNSIGGS